MDQGLKERLIGAAVLVGLGVWLIPWVLDGSGESSETRPAALALPTPDQPAPVRTQTIYLGDRDKPAADAQPRPDAPPPVVAEAESPADVEPLVASGGGGAQAAQVERDLAPPPVATPAADAKPATTEPRATALEPASTRSAATPSAKPSAAPAPAGTWVVQLGSFGEEQNARRLAQRVSSYGYRADVTSHRASGRTMYRVRVGPHESRARADAAASALAAHGFVAQVVAAD